MTKLSEAKLIVPDLEIWVAVDEEIWEGDMAYANWNSMMMEREDVVPVKRTKMGMLSEVLRKGKICRPINEFLDFKNKPICIKKGY
jgi:hypothetical protein